MRIAIFIAAVALGLLVTPQSAQASAFVSKELHLDCAGYSVSITAALDPGYVGSVQYRISIHRGADVEFIERALPIQADPTGAPVTVGESVSFPTPLSGSVTILGSAVLQDTDSFISLDGGNPIELVCPAPEPALSLEKQVSVDGGATWQNADDLASAAQAAVPSGVLYRLLLANPGTVDLTGLVVNDAALGLAAVAAGELPAGGARVIDASVPGFERLNAKGQCGVAGTFTNVAAVTASVAMPSAHIAADVVQASDSAVVVCVAPAGGEGCSHGYWKQPQHFDSWVGAMPSDSYRATFGVPASFDLSLLGALRQGGGKEKALGREAVAALLNASNPDVEYRFTPDEVLSIVRAAYATGDWNRAKDQLEGENTAGCPLH
jgi:hypothetical protein